MVQAIVAVIRWQSVVDFLVLVTAIYQVLRWGKEARALRIVLGILTLGMGSLLARQLGLQITSWVLNAASVVAIVALFVVFQTELRRALTSLDVAIRLWPRRTGVTAPALRAMSDAAFSLAATHRGALLVIVRRDPVTELIRGGVPLGGEVSGEIIEAIFRKVSPVHDGAAIIEGTRIARVATVLPLTQREDLPSTYGTRHRAALGLTERCDALVVVVSEERGEVTLIHDGDLELPRSADELFARLQRLQVDAAPERREARGTLWRVPTAHLGLKAAALGLAALAWMVPLLVIEGTVRTVTVPVEFRNVPQDLEIAESSSTAVQVQLRTSAWILDAISFTTLVARFDLAGAHEGSQAIPVDRRAPNVPPGVTVERVSPQRLTVRLVRPGDSPPTRERPRD